MALFVEAKVDRLTVETTDGPQWIDVRHRLNAGEYEAMFEAWYDDQNRFHPSRVRRIKVLAYLVGWSLTDGTTPVPVTADALRALEMTVFKAIADAVETHEEQSEAEATARKNDQDGVAAS